MKQFLKFYLLFLLAVPAAGTSRLYAQKLSQDNIDSIISALPGLKEDTNKIKLLSALSLGYQSISPDSGITAGEKGLALATNLNWKKGIATACYSIGVNYAFGKAAYPKALEFYLRALKLNEELGNKENIAGNALYIGHAYSDQGNYSDALKHYQISLKLYEELKDKSGMAAATAIWATFVISRAIIPKPLSMI